MKFRQHPHLRLLSRFLVLLTPLMCISGFVHGQQPASSTSTPAPAVEVPRDSLLLEVFLNQQKLVSADRPIDSATAEPEGVVKIDKVEGSLSQISVTGLATGHCILKIQSDNRTINYSIEVTPKPERIYINIPESKRISFPSTVDSTALSARDIVRIVQPDTDDKVLLVEAIHAGHTTLTVYVKDQIYRYFITTFENRGADVLEINNEFTEKGYRGLTITFDNDEAVLAGTVPTQEELDDAVRIVKQFTQYVIVHATIGTDDEPISDNTAEETLIVNNIKRISGVPGITIRVKYPSPTITKTTSYTEETGEYLTPETTTTPQGGVIRGSGFLPPPQEGGGNDEGLEGKPRKNTQTIVNQVQNKTVPEKIFIYGDVEDDLQQARVLRVARTFCPVIIDFMTVKDPIQLRVALKFLQTDDTKVRNTGVSWGSTGPQIVLGLSAATPAGFIGNAANTLSNLSQARSFNSAFNGVIAAGGVLENSAGGNVINATMSLFDSSNAVKLLRESSVFLSNGQPGWYSEGEVQYYVSSVTSTVTTSAGGLLNSGLTTQLEASPLFYGLNMDIAPLNVALAGGQEPTGQKILGVAASTTEGNATYSVEESNQKSDPPYAAFDGSIPNGGRNPLLDESVKYVDENGVIGLNIAAQLTIPNGVPPKATFGNGQFITLPDFFVRTTRTRASLRDGQSITLTGLVDRESTRDIQGVPFFEKIPIFSSLFKNYNDGSTDRQVFIVVTPHIVRMRDGDNARVMKPYYPAMNDIMSEQGMIPQIKPVLYPGGMDIRPEKDMKDVKGMGTPAPKSSEDQTPMAPKPTTGSAPEKPVTPSTDQTSNSDTNKVSPIDNSGVGGQSVFVGQVREGSPSTSSSTLP